MPTCYDLFLVRDWIDEKMYGVSSLQDKAAILAEIEADWTSFARRLEDMRKVSQISRRLR
jgi:hypothetical protein